MMEIPVNRPNVPPIAAIWSKTFILEDQSTRVELFVGFMKNYDEHYSPELQLDLSDDWGIKIKVEHPNVFLEPLQSYLLIVCGVMSQHRDVLG